VAEFLHKGLKGLQIRSIVRKQENVHKFHEPQFANVCTVFINTDWEHRTGSCEHGNVPSCSQVHRLLMKAPSCIKTLFCDDETLKCVCMTTDYQHTSLLEFKMYQLKSKQVLNHCGVVDIHTV
jgi:hypothetical protein